MDYKEIIKDYLIKNIMGGDGIDINDDTELILNNLIDSLSVVRLLVFLEDTFDISLDDQLDLANFSSLNNIYAMIQRKKEAV